MRLPEQRPERELTLLHSVTGNSTHGDGPVQPEGTQRRFGCYTIPKGNLVPEATLAADR